MSLDITTLRRRLQKALGKKFTVGDVLGEGGFAAVFRVRDQTLGHDVAVKVLDLGLTPSPGLAERFVRAARTPAHRADLQGRGLQERSPVHRHALPRRAVAPPVARKGSAPLAARCR